MTRAQGAPVDPRERAREQARRTRDVIRQNHGLFRPLSVAMAQSVRNGGRVLLLGEGRLHGLADYLARVVIAQENLPNAPTLSVDPIAIDPAGANATARCIGPFDALLGLSETCEEPLFRALLDAARSRGAKVLCLCVGPSRLEGRADVAIDIPEPRSYRVPGLLSTVLHYVAKLAVADLKANPMARPSRLDEGPRRGGEPEDPADNDEPTITLDLPDDAFDIAFVDEELTHEVYGGGTPPTGPVTSAPAPRATEPPRGGPTEGARAFVASSASSGFAPVPAPAPAPAPRAPLVGAGWGGFGPDDTPPSEAVTPPPGAPRLVEAQPVRSAAPSHSGPSVSAVELPAIGPNSNAGHPTPAPFDDREERFDSLDDDELLHPQGLDGDESEGLADLGGARPGTGRIIMFRCKRCREALLAEPSMAGGRAQCPFCGRRVKVPRSRGRPYRTGKSPLSQGARRVALRFSSEECRLSIMPQGGFPIEARLVDITPEGIEATVRKEDADLLSEGVPVRLRLVATAFLEPLVAVAQLERIVEDGINGEEIGRQRLLLPLAPDTPRDVRDRLSRLAELASREVTG